MAPSRATYVASDTSDDDDVTPESLTLTGSKEQAKRLTEARQAAESDAKRRRKEKNRRVDENLKRRALETRGASQNLRGGVGKAGKMVGKRNRAKDEETRNLEDRMDRAMREADGEDDEEANRGRIGDDSELEDSSEAEQESDGLGSTSEEEESSESGSVGDEGPMDTIDEVESHEGSSSRGTLKDPRMEYLPDELFAEALSKVQAPTRHQPASSSTEPLRQSEQKRKPPKKCSSKDIILGSKTIRPVPSKTSHISSAASRTLPPGKVKRFYEDRLSLKSKHAGKASSPWDRRAANIGIMRSTTLPAANFVRNS